MTLKTCRVMHRADYQNVLAEEARRLGAQFQLGADVIKVDSNDEHASVTLASGEQLHADIVVGADGLRSEVRTYVLGYVKEPEESGDLAYRITIPRNLLEHDPDSFVRGVVTEKIIAIWWGENMHAVLYTVRGNEMANLVLMCESQPTFIVKDKLTSRLAVRMIYRPKYPSNQETWLRCTNSSKIGIPDCKRS